MGIWGVARDAVEIQGPILENPVEKNMESDMDNDMEAGGMQWCISATSGILVAPTPGILRTVP